MKNTMLKVRDKSNPYEIWENNRGWQWNVLKKWQAEDTKPHARWFCYVVSPICSEYGDCYASEIMQYAHKVEG